MDSILVLLAVGCLFFAYKYIDWKLRFRGLLWWVAIEKECTPPDANVLMECILKSVRQDINDFRYGNRFKR